MADAGMIGLVSAVAGAAVGALGNSILGEEYRRVRDRKALCAGLAGELNALLLVIDGRMVGLRSTHTKLTTTHVGKKVVYRDHPLPDSIVYGANPTKLGFLGADLARVVAFAYVYVDSMRLTFAGLGEQLDEFSPENQCAAIGEILSDYENAHFFALEAADALAKDANRQGFQEWGAEFLKTGLFKHVRSFMGL